MSFLFSGFLVAAFGCRLYFQPFTFQPKRQNLDDEVISEADRRYAQHMRAVGAVMTVAGLIGMVVGLQAFLSAR